MEDGKKEISKLFGGKPVSYCHNPTAMAHDDDLVGYLGDLSQAGTQKLGRITDEVNRLAQHLQQAVAAVGRRGKVIHIAHSQGALVTSLAAKRLSRDEMSRIEIIAFGGAAALQKTTATPFGRCVNYYAANDPLLLVVPQAAQALRSGFATSSGSIANEEEFCCLTPREGDPVADHALLGKTYGQALAWEGKRFQTMYQSALYRSSRSVLLSIVWLLTAIDTQLKELFKRLILFMVHLVHTFWTMVKCRIVAPFVIFLMVVVDFVHAVWKRSLGREQYLPVDTIPREGGEKVGSVMAT